MIAISGTRGGKGSRRDKMLRLVFSCPAVICPMGATAGEQDKGQHKQTAEWAHNENILLSWLIKNPGMGRGLR
ncbi:hypothetical protein D3C78_1884480 [compost metagenome]